MSAPALEASGWGWRYAGRRAWAVRGLDVRIEAGERVLLVGASGAGKSTLLTAFAGLLDPASGDQEGGLRVHGAPPRLARDHVGYLFQDPEAQIVMARVRDEVAFALENRCVSRERIWPRVAAALSEVGFRYPGHHATAALSGGEQQRLALAATLAAEPSVLLLDEPTANLDTDAAAAFRAVLADRVAQTDATLLLVEHRLDLALDLVDRVLVLEAGGGLIADGTPAEVFGRHGDELALRGVWVPNHPPVAPRRSARRSPGASLLVAADVAFRYPGAPLPAVDGASATLRAGEALGIQGPNGSGKSTLLLLLAGLLRPTRGTVRATPALDAEGGEVWRWPARRLAARIGTVFQDPEHQFLTGRVTDEMTLGPRRLGLSEREARRRADELLDRLHLAPLAEANPYTLSGGEKRRLSVATALVAAPSLLLLDEPTFGQDRRTYTEILELLAGLVDAGRSVGFVTHDTHFAELLADRRLMLAAPAASASAA